MTGAFGVMGVPGWGSTSATRASGPVGPATTGSPRKPARSNVHIASASGSPSRFGTMTESPDETVRDIPVPALTWVAAAGSCVITIPAASGLSASGLTAAPTSRPASAIAARACSRYRPVSCGTVIRRGSGIGGGPSGTGRSATRAAR